jgi:hypothetical protein
MRSSSSWVLVTGNQVIIDMPHEPERSKFHLGSYSEGCTTEMAPPVGSGQAQVVPIVASQKPWPSPHEYGNLQTARGQDCMPNISIKSENDPHTKRRISMPRIWWKAGHESSSLSLRCMIRHSSVYLENLLTIICTLKVVSFLAGFMTESQTLTFAIFGGTLTAVLLVCILNSTCASY